MAIELNERSYKYERHARWVARQELRRNPPPPPKRLNIHPLEGLLNLQGRYALCDRKPMSYVPFPEEEHYDYP